MPENSEPRRSLLIIGGAEDKIGRVTILRRFVRLAGGRKSNIVVIPTASSLASEVSSVDPQTRLESSSPELVERIDNATGVFISGGNQLKLSQLIVGTPLGDAMLRAYERGAVIAGTSAGASIMSQFMISMGEEGVTPRQRSSQLTQGLGLVPGVIIDQHFDQRSRYGRLLSLVAGSPSLLGMGIDEDTAVVVEGDAFSVLGSGAVSLLEMTRAYGSVLSGRTPLQAYGIQAIRGSAPQPLYVQTDPAPAAGLAEAPRTMMLD